MGGLANYCLSVLGNLEIGNGYGVPGGGAYHISSKSSITNSSKITVISLLLLYLIKLINV